MLIPKKKETCPRCGGEDARVWPYLEGGDTDGELIWRRCSACRTIYSRLTSTLAIERRDPC